MNRTDDRFGIDALWRVLRRGVNFWIAAAPKVSVMVGLDGVRQRTDAEVIVPVMDG